MTVFSVGGCIHAMAWDQNGARLAVQFTGALVNYVMTKLFTTNFLPSCFVIFTEAFLLGSMLKQ
jgi:hypothetical protein